jgi:hypothetical protein
MSNPINTRTAAARAFVRSLNILLKFARMYDFGHPRTAKQYETAFAELRTALGTDDEAGMLLAVSGDQLLIDGTPLEAAASEKSFARMLSSAGIASIHFAPKTPPASLAKFVRGFPTGNSTKPAQLAEQMKANLEGDHFIHVNEVCFVPADSAVAKSTVAAQLAARTLGMNSSERDELFKDPERLLQLIVAAEGTKGGPGGPGEGGGDWRRGGHGGSGSGQGGSGDGSGSGSGNGQGDGNGSGGYGGGVPGGAGAYAAGAIALEGPSSAVWTAPPGQGHGGWNIVGGSGSGNGAVLDPNAGGFWLNKDDSAQSPNGGPAASLSGPAAGVGGGNAGWNIVGDAHGGTSVDANSGGFWLNKDAAPVGASAGGSSASLQGPAAGVGVAGGSGAAPGHGRGGAGNGSAYGSGGPSEQPSTRWASASTGIRSGRNARGGPGSMTVETGLMTLQEQELQGILQVLAQIARTNGDTKERLDPSSFQSRLSTLPRRARFTVSQALSALAAQAPAESSDKPTLMKLAEHIAVRFALESYERGDVKVNAVRQMLSEMSTELDGLRKILGVYEERMERAGLETQSHIEVLAQEFWTQVPDERRKEVLEGADAWCVPGGKVREYVENLRKAGDVEGANKVLRNFASCVTDKVPDHRRQAAMGLAELAACYADGDEKLLVDTIRRVGLQLAEEKDSTLQSLVGAAFVRLSQEATRKRAFPAVQRAIELIDYVEIERPGSSKSLRPRVGVENRLPEFIDDALKNADVPNGLSDLLRRMPQAAADNIAARFSRLGFREDCEFLISLIETLGPEALDHLRKQLQHGDAHQAIDTVGILARLDAPSLEQLLPERMRDWKRTAHDRMVRQIAASGATDRGRLLLQLLDDLDPLIRPLAIDEIGMSGERTADMRLLRMAEGDLPRNGTEYLQLKAIEALGRLRTSGAETVLRKIAEARKAFRWASPSEMRIVAAQAMEKIDPDWVRNFLPQSGLNTAELSIEPLDADPSSSATRQRRYPRLRMEKPVPGATLNLKENCRLEIPEMALSGGVALSEQNLHPGSVVEMRFNAGQKPVRAQTIIRDTNTQARAFEVVEMDLEERTKLRKLLVQLGNAQRESKPQDRNRRGPRTIFSTQG